MTRTPDAGPSSGESGGRPFPWPPEEEPVADALFRTWRDSVFEPSRFFAALPRRGRLGAPVLYYLIVGLVSAGVGLFWGTVSLAAGLADEGVVRVLLGSPEAGWAAVLGFLLSPLFLLFGLAIAAAVVHVCLLLAGGARHGFGTTARVLCFAYGPQLFSIVPLVGGLVAFFWMLVVAVIGLREAHETEGWRAALAVALPLVALFALAIVAAFVVVLLGGSFDG